MSRVFHHFQDAIRCAGLEPPDIIVPGKLHRFPGGGKRSGNRAGWCLLFNDELGGCFGDWSSNLYRLWRPNRDKPYTQSERAEVVRRTKNAKMQVKAERDARQADAAIRATAIWNTAIPATSAHPYLLRKQIKPNSAKVHKGALTLPVVDFFGRLTSLQFIASDGNKRLLTGGRKRGCFIPVGGPGENPSRVIICEGWATGCTLAGEDSGDLVLAAIDAGNLEAVALSARYYWPTAQLVIASDDDRQTAGNPGATKARAAASASGAQLIMPQWPQGAPDHLTDFNDLSVWLAGGDV